MDPTTTTTLFSKTPLIPVTIQIIWAYVVDEDDEIQRMLFYQPNGSLSDIIVSLPRDLPTLTNPAVAPNVICRLYDSTSSQERHCHIVQSCIDNENVDACCLLLERFLVPLHEYARPRCHIQLILDMFNVVAARVSMRMLCNLMDRTSRRWRDEGTLSNFTEAWTLFILQLLDGRTVMVTRNGKVVSGKHIFQQHLKMALNTLKTNILTPLHYAVSYDELVEKTFNCDRLSKAYKLAIADQLDQISMVKVGFRPCLETWSDVHFNINLFMLHNIIPSSKQSQTLPWLRFGPSVELSESEVAGVILWVLQEISFDQSSTRLLFLQTREEGQVVQKLNKWKSRFPSSQRGIVGVKLVRSEWASLMETACKMRHHNLMHDLRHYADYARNLRHGYLPWPDMDCVSFAEVKLLLKFRRIVSPGGMAFVVLSLAKRRENSQPQILHLLQMDFRHWPVPVCEGDWWSRLCVSLRSVRFIASTPERIRWNEILQSSNPPFTFL